jgi:hypothetical protein
MGLALLVCRNTIQSVAPAATPDFASACFFVTMDIYRNLPIVCQNGEMSENI